MRIETVRYLVHLLFTITILEEVLGEIKESVCSICNCSGKTINCRNHNLNSSFSESAWQGRNYSEFTDAIFDNNHIGHLIKLPSLPIKTLSYKNNRLVKIDPRAFINLTNLEELDLSGNELTSENLTPSVFEGPYDPGYYEPLLKLVVLDLNGNELHTLHRDLFQHTQFLQRLYLRDNPFKILDKATVIAISSLPHLRILDLSHTKIQRLPTGFLHTPRNLHELVLKGNLFREIPSDNLAECHNLTILNLNDNPIKVLSTEIPFPEMPSLKQLHISFMPNLTRIEEGSLSGLTNLEYLHCRMNKKLSYISPTAFKNEHSEWPNLIKMDLSDNDLSYIDEAFLKPVMNNIKQINIVGNPLICDCENQWIVSKLVPLMMSISSPVNELECAEPSAMKGQRLVTLYSKNYTMRCLDIYGNHPEHDGPVLISIFVMVIITLIIVLGLVIWVKNNNTCRQGGRVNYHRAFYRPTRLEDPEKY